MQWQYTRHAIGDRFGSLVIVDETVTRAKNGRALWQCQCDCGTRCVVQGTRLRLGLTKSCVSCGRAAGSIITAAKRTRHGMWRSSEYRIWVTMRQRCQNPKTPNYVGYGARGITVCDRWQTFENFYADMGARPSMRHSIDRIDNDGPYSPENCRWATPTEQASNTKSNHRLTYGGRTQTMSQWAREIGVPFSVLDSRCRKLGWSTERALTEPYIPLTDGFRVNSGYPGVYWRADRQKWYVRIKVSGRPKHLGIFQDKQDAIEVARVALSGA